MHVVTVRFLIKPEHQSNFMSLMLQNASESRRLEAGCRQFDVCSDTRRPGEVFLYEVYDDSAAFDVHLQSSHFREFDAATQHMIDSKNVTTFDQCHA